MSDNKYKMSLAEAQRISLLVSISDPQAAMTIAHLVISRMTDEEVIDLIRAIEEAGQEVKKGRTDEDWLEKVAKGIQ